MTDRTHTAVLMRRLRGLVRAFNVKQIKKVEAYSLSLELRRLMLSTGKNPVCRGGQYFQGRGLKEREEKELLDTFH